MPEKTIQVGLGGIAILPGRLRALRPAVVDELVQSMRERGQLQAVALRPDDARGYYLIAGRHRIEAAKKLKWQSIRATIFEDVAADTAELAEIDENLVRAELTPAERALHVGRRKELYEKAHGKAKARGANAANKKMGRDANAKMADAFTKDAAGKTGKSERSMQRDVTRAGKVEVLAEIAGTSLDKGDEIDALAKLNPKEQRSLAKAAAKGKKVSAKTRVKQVARETREKDLAAKQVALPAKRYGVILADPEWRFEVWSRETGMDRAADNHYATTVWQEIEKRDVPSIAARDAVLFLWATVPMLPQALDVMKAWGFRYVSHAVWVKDRVGTGYWFRNQHELFLVGTRGEIPAPAPGKQSPSVIHAPVGRHSAKPEAFLELIERYFPNLPKIELNRRGPARKGWDAWGNEAEEAT